VQIVTVSYANSPTTESSEELVRAAAAENAKIDIPPLTGIHAEPVSFGKLIRMMGFFGPAAVVASLALGAGETIMVTALGAWSEYGLLWLLVLCVIVKGVFVTYLIGRYTAITGERIIHRLARLPGPRGWLLVGVIAAETIGVSMGLTAVSKPCGNLISFLLQDWLSPAISLATWENGWTTMLLGTALLVSLSHTYQGLERQQIIMCGLLVGGTLLATILVWPDLVRLAIGAVSFGSLPPAPAWAPANVRNEYLLTLTTVFGYVGGGLSGYLAYSTWVSINGWGINSHPRIAEIRERIQARHRVDHLPEDPVQIRRLHVLLSPLRWDVGMGALVLFVITAAFLAAGATVLYPRQQVVGDNAWELLTKQASIWREVHHALVPVYYVLIIVALWGALASIPEAITRVLHESLSAVWPRFEQVPLRSLKRLVVIWIFVTCMIWIWSGVTFDLLTQISAFAALGVMLSLVFCCVLYFNLTLPRGYRPPWWLVAGAVLSAAILLLATTGSGVGLIRKIAFAL